VIWLTWRQHRAQAAATYGALAVLAVILAITGPELAHLRDISGGDFLNRAQGSQLDGDLYLVSSIFLLAFPAILGAFWGAPLVARELDAGTHRLIWNQSITRTRWLAAKLGLTGLGAMAAAGLLSLAVTWWAAPLDQAAAAGADSAAPAGYFFPRISPMIFNARGIAPIGYAAFAFALGVTLGVLTRRVVTGMVLTLASTAIAEVLVSMFVRPSLVTPRRVTAVITPANLMNQTTVNVHVPGAWLTSTRVVDAAGHPASNVTLMNWLKCYGTPGHVDMGCIARLNARGYRAVVAYQPAGHFWSLQGSETAIFVVLALLLGAFCVWWIRRRVS
jgi:hypothetical protein